MSKSLLVLLVLPMLLTTVIAAPPGGCRTAATKALPFCDLARDHTARATDLVARLTLRDGKPRYLADTPRFVDYVMQVVPRYPELAPLRAIFERHVLSRG